MGTTAPSAPTMPTTRRVRFAWPEDLDPMWTPDEPEFAVAANAVSLLMPHAEPYVVASVRAAIAELAQDPSADPDLLDRARAYAGQEAQHHAQHHRFNDLVIARYPNLAAHDRRMKRVFAGTKSVEVVS